MAEEMTSRSIRTYNLNRTTDNIKQYKLLKMWQKLTEYTRLKPKM